MNYKNYEYREMTSTHSKKKSELYTKELDEITGGLTGKKILDFGCGCGELTKNLAQKNEVYGIDFDKKSVITAKKNGLKASLCDLNKEIKFKNNFFDIVIARDILEHITNVDLATNEIKRVLKNKGYLLLDLPNEFALDGRINVLFGKGVIKKRWFPDAKEWNNPHVRFYTRKGARELLSSRGFKIKKDLSYLSAYYSMTFLGKFLPQLFCGGIVFIAQKIN